MNYHDKLMQEKSKVLDALSHILKDFFIYSKKEYSESGSQYIRDLITTGNLTKEEIMNHVAKELTMIFQEEFGE